MSTDHFVRIVLAAGNKTVVALCACGEQHRFESRDDAEAWREEHEQSTNEFEAI